MDIPALSLSPSHPSLAECTASSSCSLRSILIMLPLLHASMPCNCRDMLPTTSVLAEVCNEGTATFSFSSTSGEAFLATTCCKRIRTEFV